jgi:hypothetical protein
VLVLVTDRADHGHKMIALVTGRGVHSVRHVLRTQQTDPVMPLFGIVTPLRQPRLSGARKPVVPPMVTINAAEGDRCTTSGTGTIIVSR